MTEFEKMQQQKKETDCVMYRYILVDPQTPNNEKGYLGWLVFPATAKQSHPTLKDIDIHDKNFPEKLFTVMFGIFDKTLANWKSKPMVWNKKTKKHEYKYAGQDIYDMYANDLLDAFRDDSLEIGIFYQNGKSIPGLGHNEVLYDRYHSIIPNEEISRLFAGATRLSKEYKSCVSIESSPVGFY